MGGEYFILSIVFVIGVLSPIAKAVAARIARPGDASGAETKRLTGALHAAEQRIAESERRIGSMEERLDFYEKLLGEPDRARQLRG
jgi:hypothetical protein